MSMPDEFIIHAAEGKLSTGPTGTLVSPDCPFVVKKLADPLNKSLEQVWRWIMEMFQLNEETHEITLQHILYVRNNLLAPPSTVLIDIIGDDSWRAFLNVAWPHVGAFILLVTWSVKKTTYVSKAIDATAVADEDPAITDEFDHGSWPTCKHDKPCTIDTLWDSQDQGRRFYRCPFFADFKEACGFTQWLGKEFPEKATVLMNYPSDSVDSLQQQVDNLKCELEELRRCHKKRSRGETAVSNGDERILPNQIRKMAEGN